MIYIIVSDYITISFPFKAAGKVLFNSGIFRYELRTYCYALLLRRISTSLFGTPKIIGSVALAALCFIVFIFDIKGVAAINIILVPVIIIIITITAVNSILSQIYSPAFFLTDFFMGSDRNVVLLSICYVSYNTLTAASVLSPISKTLKSRRTALIASSIAGAIIGLLIFLVWFAVGSSFGKVGTRASPSKAGGKHKQKL